PQCRPPRPRSAGQAGRDLRVTPRAKRPVERCANVSELGEVCRSPFRIGQVQPLRQFALEQVTEKPRMAVCPTIDLVAPNDFLEPVSTHIFDQPIRGPRITRLCAWKPAG